LMSNNREPSIAVGNIPGFWEMLHSAHRSFLALDYDGTLAPFHIERMEARPLPGTIELLVKIRDKTGGSLAVISGRPLSEVLALLGDLTIMLVGSHGHEFRYPNKSLIIKRPSADQSEGLDKARDVCIKGGLGSRIETKGASIAVHTRGLPTEEAGRIEEWVRAGWNDLAPAYGLYLRMFNGGVELRCTGMDKGDALRTLLSLLDDDTFCVYIGDDETDEDAFRAVRGRGFGVRVGDPGSPTDALGFLPDIAAVQQFLQGWLSHAPAGVREEVAWNRED
jgi:trehalose 6-phosphate phosphatase